MTDLPRWNLATTSYSAFRPGMGVPVKTSLGAPKYAKYAYVDAPILHPRVTFRSKAPLEQHPFMYQRYLTQWQPSVEDALDELTDVYGSEEPLVLLCFEGMGEAMSGGCHRRWLADWLLATFDLVVPEVGYRPPVPQRAPEPMLW